MGAKGLGRLLKSSLSIIYLNVNIWIPLQFMFSIHMIQYTVYTVLGVSQNMKVEKLKYVQVKGRY